MPIVLHLFRRRADPVVPFTAVRFLRRAPVEQARRRRLRDLAAARVAGGGAGAARALVRAPVLGPPQAASGTSPLTVVALDTSYSVSTRGTGRPRPGARPRRRGRRAARRRRRARPVRRSLGRCRGSHRGSRAGQGGDRRDPRRAPAARVTARRSRRRPTWRAGEARVSSSSRTSRRAAGPSAPARHCPPASISRCATSALRRVTLVCCRSSGPPPASSRASGATGPTAARRWSRSRSTAARPHDRRSASSREPRRRPR